MSFSQYIDTAWTLLSDQVRVIALIGLPLLLLALLLNRGNFETVLRRSVGSGWRVNVLVLLFDVLAVAGPVSMLAGLIIAAIGGGPDKHDEIFDAINPAVTLVIAIFAGDAVGYFRHRLEHTRWLWPSHSLHHSDAEMNVLTIVRFHPLNRLTTVVIDLTALVALGLPYWAIWSALAVRHAYGVFVHANVPWTLGPLGRVLVSPAMHRWHHVREGQGMRSNFASIFSVFDQLFGTYYCPGPCTVPLGVEGAKHNEFVSQMVEPFAVAARATKRLLLRPSKEDLAALKE